MSEQTKKPKRSKPKGSIPKGSIPKGLVPSRPFTSKKIFRVVLFSVVGSISVILMSRQIGEFSGSESIAEVGLIFGIIMAVIPVTLWQLKEVQRRDSVDKHMPVFLLALLSSTQSGANLMKAIEQTANRNLGALTAPLKNLRANLSWGMPIDEAFDNFSHSTGTRISKRVTLLLQMALKIGGDVSENLEMIQKHVSDMQNLEKSRKSQLAPYTYTIYISYIVFLAVAILLVTSFFSEIEKVQVSLVDSEVEGGLFGSLADMDIGVMEDALFNMSIIEAIFGGLAAGKIGAGSYVAGVKHVVLMIILAVIAFNIV